MHDGLMKIKERFVILGSLHMNDGNQIRFWEDKWLGDTTFKEQYPSLYNIVRRKNTSAAMVMNSVPLNVSFHRALVGNNLVQ